VFEAVLVNFHHVTCPLSSSTHISPRVLSVYVVNERRLTMSLTCCVDCCFI